MNVTAIGLFNVKAIANFRFGTVLFIGVSSSCCGPYGVDVVLTFKEVERGRRIASFPNFFSTPLPQPVFS